MKEKRKLFQRFLDLVERVGNKLPDPFAIFIGLAVFMIIISWCFSLFNASVVHPGNGETLPIKSLISAEGLQFILTSMLDNFTGFAPLGLVLVMMLGVGLAEKVGMLDYAVRKTILKSPPYLLTYTVVFVGIMGNLASDAAIVLVPPLAALVFYKVGRHPLAGLAAGFAGAGAGFTANLFVAGTDALLAGISTEAARFVDETMTVTPVDNWFFNIVSVFALTFVGGLVTTRLIEPRLGKYTGEAIEEDKTEDLPQTKKAFIYSLIAGLIYVLIIVGTIFIPNSPLTNEEGGLIPSPFLDGIIPIILFFFLIIGITFGIVVGTIKSSKDVSHYMAESIKDMSSYIVLVFAIAQFTAYFNWSNLGTWLAVNGAELLESINFTGLPLIIAYIIFTSMLNFLLTSGSAKWAIEAPIFVPMFMQLGYHPAFTQVAYRVGDSSTNIITPLFPYMVIVLAFMQRYDKKASIGTYISLMLPYSIAFLITWIILIIAFYYFGIPFGPGIHARY
ncbi:AbgT family transporter [Sporosarcina pasteurii]|uniref:Aminobenzoyl-glutamate transport protein n=1 Tax=Sporosarcina pasteurii TaxID=1474 RepID=A0A380C0G7_SPOPA|nr:AbgT family transporter [Sporosarcina pasteurii]MDS9471480.1 AbgT family transporter [Sporosarcina pasteurii]QBQ04899.1 AbgT family transporter [Sporosarcina pasteurii]SUJ10502.1 Aminobenzoyl-glutamate transport protein [Sporosarcina pasteurii]